MPIKPVTYLVHTLLFSLTTLCCAPNLHLVHQSISRFTARQLEEPVETETKKKITGEKTENDHTE